MITDCGAANLTAAILGLNPDNVKRIFNIPDGRDYCPQCGKLDYLSKKTGYCSRKCKDASKWIKVSCSYCGNLIERYTHQIIWKSNHPQGFRKEGGQEYYFCNHVCQGKWLAENYGFGKFPEHRKGAGRQ